MVCSRPPGRGAEFSESTLALGPPPYTDSDNHKYAAFKWGSILLLALQEPQSDFQISEAISDKELLIMVYDPGPKCSKDGTEHPIQSSKRIAPP